MNAKSDRSQAGHAAMRPWRILAALMLLVLVAGACNGTGELPDGTLTRPETSTPPDTEAPPETSPPETAPPETAPPETEAPPENVTDGEAQAGAEEGDSEVQPWVWVVLGLIVILLLVGLVGRRRTAPQANSVPTDSPDPVTNEALGDAYGISRRLYDQLNVTLATWRGDYLYSQETGFVESADPTQVASWERLGEQMDSALTALYRLESVAQGSPTAATANALGKQLTQTRAAVDQVATARKHSRTVESGPESGVEAVQSARAAERQAVDQLSAQRERLRDLLNELSRST